MSDSLTPPASQSKAKATAATMRTTTDHLDDPFVEATPSRSPARPLTPTTHHDNWRDDTVSAESSPPSAPSAQGSPAQGSKRTASGHVKSTAPAATVTPSARMRPHGHKRTPSTESSLGNISQLSEQLKTRLSYAMVKVQNGWETCSIDEVETLASQLASPRSTSSPFRRSLTSPRVSMANVNRRSRDLSQITSQMYAMSPPEPPNSSSRRSNLMQPPAMGPLSGLSASPATRSSFGHYPSLAPPVSFNRRVSDSHSDLSRNDPNAAGYSQPKTPTPQEQDAVDTLMFMSSPANSQFPAHMGGSSSQPSRLRSETGWGQHPGASTSSANINMTASQPQQLQRPWATRTRSDESSSSGNGNDAASRSSASTNYDERQAKRRSLGLLKSNRDVDRLLDDMDEGGNSTEDEEEAADDAEEEEKRKQKARKRQGIVGPGQLQQQQQQHRRPPASVGHLDVCV